MLDIFLKYPLVILITFLLTNCNRFTDQRQEILGSRIGLHYIGTVERIHEVQSNGQGFTSFNQSDASVSDVAQAAARISEFYSERNSLPPGFFSDFIATLSAAVTSEAVLRAERTRCLYIVNVDDNDLADNIKRQVLNEFESFGFDNNIETFDAQSEITVEDLLNSDLPEGLTKQDIQQALDDGIPVEDLATLLSVNSKKISSNTKDGKNSIVKNPQFISIPQFCNYDIASGKKVSISVFDEYATVHLLK